MAGCNKANYGNTGLAACKTLQNILRHLIIVPTLDSSGTAVSETVANLKDWSAISANFTAADPKDRWYPLKNIENVDHQRLDSVFQEFNSGRTAKVREGYKRFIGFIPEVEYAYKEEVDKVFCLRSSAFGVDSSDNLVGYSDDDIVTSLIPIRIEDGSYDSVYKEPTDSEVGGLMIRFDWSFNMKDGDFFVIDQEDMDWVGADMEGLITARFAISSITTTSFQIQLQTPYGHAITDLTDSDMALAETSPTPGAVTIDSVTETADGVYTVDYTTAAMSSADEMTLTITKSPYDFSDVTAYNIVLP